MTTLIRIGNFQGVHIPKAVIEQAQLENKELAFQVIDDGLLIHPITKPREGWKKQFDKASGYQELSTTEQEWLSATLSNEEGWEW